METAALGFIRGGSSRHILISTKPISEASRRNRRGCWRLLPYLSVPKIEEMFNAGFGFAACACAARVGYPPRDRHDFDPEVLDQVKRGHRDGAQEGVGYC